MALVNPPAAALIRSNAPAVIFFLFLDAATPGWWLPRHVTSNRVTRHPFTRASIKGKRNVSDVHLNFG